MTGTADKLIRYLLEEDREKLFDLTEHRARRSLNANAYAWALIGKIADYGRESKEAVYLDMLKHYGQSEYISVLKGIDISGFVKYYEEAGEGTILDRKTGEPKTFTHYKVYKGSSEYNTQEMAILIDGIVREAESLGIETLTPAEIERMKSEWNQKANPN